MKKLHLLSIFFLTLMACSSGDDGPTGPGGSLTFDEVISGGGDFAPVEEDSTLISEETTADVVGTETFICTTRRISITEGPSEFPQFDPNASVIYPGNLLQGSTLSNATPSPIPVRRGGGRIVMTLVNGSESVSRNIAEVSLGSIFDAANSIIASASEKVPARFSFVKEEIHSREQLGLALDFQYNSLATEVKGALSFSSDRQYNRYLVKLVQSYYTMAFEIPTAVEDFFAPDITPAELKPFIYAGNPGAFIESVTYGRQFYLLIESTASRTELAASVEASFSAAVTSGSIGGGVTYVQDLENVRINAYAVGGDASDALSAITTDFDTLKGFLAAGGTIDTGVPLSYKVHSLAQRDKVVSVAVATTYDVTTCTPVGESFDAPLFWYQGEFATTGAGGQVKRWDNRFGEASFDATPLNGKVYGGTKINNQINGLPVLRFGNATSSNGAALAFPGLNLAQGDYTVIAVARLTSSAVSYPEFFLWGTSAGDDRNLQLGWRDPNRVTMDHQGQRLDATTGLNHTQFSVYTFRFSQMDGMQIWVNGLQVPVGEDGDLNTALLDFLGARVGSRNGATVDIAEIKAYGEAIDVIQREYLIGLLLTKYSL